MDEQLEFLKIIAERLEEARIADMVTGSLAMAAYAIPRMTRDIDIVIECHPGDVDRIAQLFKADCFIDTESICTAIAQKDDVQCHP